jgi:lysophospholipase L1-like esterase
MKINKLNIYLCIISLFLTIILFSYVFYKSEILAAGHKHDYYLKYFVTTFVLFFFSIFILFLKKNTIFACFTIIISSTITIYTVELFLTINLKKSSNVKLKYIDEFKINDPSIVPVIYYADHKKINTDKKIVPLAGVSGKKTIFCQEGGPMIEYESDRFGFNNFDYIWDKKDIFAVTVGDSFTHGACVDTKNTIANNINKNEFLLNLGIGGTGPLIQFATIKEYLNRANPKRIIWIYYEENDLGDLIFENSDPILKKYLEDENFSQKLILKQKKINKKLIQALHNEINIKDRITINNLKNFIKLNFVRKKFVDNLFAHEVNVPQEFTYILNSSKKIAKEKNLKFYFVYLPEKNRFKKNLANDKEFRNYQEILNIVKNLNIPLIDLKSEFKKLSNPINLYNKDHPHLNILGYETVAKLIYEKIGEFEK